MHPIPKHLHATQSAQMSPSVHQPRANGCAHDSLLGKRHTILNHHAFHSAVKNVDDSPLSFKKQKVMTQVNTRHVALHYPHSSHEYHPLVPLQVSRMY